MEPLHRSVGVRFERHDLRRAASLASHILEEKAVHAIADTEGEHARGLPVLLNRVENCHIVPDEPVRHEAHDTEPLGIVLIGERGANRGHHFGPAAAVEILKVLKRLYPVFTRVQYRLVETIAESARKGHQIEGIVRIHLLDGQAHGLLRLLDREAAHGSALVNDEDHFLRRHRVGSDPVRRLKNEREKLTSLAGMRQDSVANRLAGHRVPEHKIPIRNFLLVLECDPRAL